MDIEFQGHEFLLVHTDGLDADVMVRKHPQYVCTTSSICSGHSVSVDSEAQLRATVLGPSDASVTRCAVAGMRCHPTKPRVPMKIKEAVLYIKDMRGVLANGMGLATKLGYVMASSSCAHGTHWSRSW